MENKKRIIGYIDNYPEDRIEHFEFLKYMFETYPRYMQHVLSRMKLCDNVYAPVDYTVTFHDFEFFKADFFLVFNVDTRITLPRSIPVILIVKKQDSSCLLPNVRVIKEIEFFESIKKHLISIDFPFLYDFLLTSVRDYCDKAIDQLSKPTTNLLTFKPQTNGKK